MFQTEQVETKIDKISIVLQKISERIKPAGHEAQTLPLIHEVLMLCCSVFEKVNTEAARIGIIKRKLTLPPSEQFSSGQVMADLVKMQFQVCAKLFKLILSFGKRYINSSYSITLYLNMGRLINAEIELNELLKSAEYLLSQCNFLRVQNICYVAFTGMMWKKMWQTKKAKLLRAK